MKKTHNAFTEHYLIPAVLFLLNICLAHVIHAFVTGSTSLTRIALTVALVLLGSSLLFKKQFLLTGSILFYSLVALWV